MHFPMPPGAPVHECVGQVVASTSARFQQGDWVMAIPDGNQGLAEFFTAQERRAVSLPPHLDRYDTCPLIQPLSTVLNAVDRLGEVRGRSVLVMGLGSIGLMFCWLLQQRGAAAITGIDPLAERCALAETIGATATYTMRGIESAHWSRLDPGCGLSAEIVIEAVGHQPFSINDCLQLVQKDGTVVAFGVPDDPVYPLEYEIFFRKNARLQAVVTPDWSRYLPAARDLFLAHRATLEPLFTHCYPIVQAGQAFEHYEKHADGIIKLLLNATCWGSDCE